MFKVIRILIFTVIGAFTVGQVWKYLRPLGPNDFHFDDNGIEVTCTESVCTCRVPFRAELSREAYSRLIGKKADIRLKSTFNVNGRPAGQCSASNTFPVNSEIMTGFLSCTSAEAAAETTAMRALVVGDETVRTECHSELTSEMEVLSALATEDASPPSPPPPPPPPENPPKQSDRTQRGPTELGSPPSDDEPEHKDPDQPDTDIAPPPAPPPRTCTSDGGEGESGVSFPSTPAWSISTTQSNQPNWTVIAWGLSYRDPNVSRTAATGSIRASLWALPEPFAADGGNGYRIALVEPRFYGYGAKSSNQIYNYSSTQLRQTVIGRNPPPGVYCMVVELEQYDPGRCSAADGFCLADWRQYGWRGFW